MKLIIRNKILFMLGIPCLFLTFGMVSGCVVRPYAGVAVSTPTAEVTVDATVPDDYVWDGYEYVGVVGDQYYYLGPDHVWLVADPVRLGRFHGWEGSHPDWRTHAIRNDQFRRDAHGHVVQPRRDRPVKRDDQH
jgi:hypothetical protein